MKTVKELYEAFIQNTQQVIIGHEKPIRELFIAIFCRGHVLLEGVPGIAKTLLAKTVAKSLSLEFSRVQFTPDLMPSDIVGTNVFNFETRKFVLLKGPIFTEILLCDEINRTPPKTQAALLEAMEEHQVTIDGQLYPLSKSFFVIATQNPLEHEGTYPLPEAQLDRFLMKIYMGNLKQDDIKAILNRFSQEPEQQQVLLSGIKPLIDKTTLEKYRSMVFEIKIDTKVLDYVAALHSETQINPSLSTGISARAALHLLLASRVHAATMGRDFVTPDDIKGISFAVLCHRLYLKPDVEFEGTTPRQVLEQIFDKIVVPK